VPLSSEPKTPTKSILKPDSNVRAKTDLDYEAQAVSSGSSTEDLARSFTDVIIDPLPGHGRRSAPETPFKKLNGRVSGVSSSSLTPQSLNISADGDLASKLARLAGEADCIKQKMSDTGTRPQASTRSSVFQKSSSMDCEPNSSNNRSLRARCSHDCSPHLVRRQSHGVRK
jgi:hypothetical protein